MVKRQQPTNSSSVFDHFVELALKGLSEFILWPLSIPSRGGRKRAREKLSLFQQRLQSKYILLYYFRWSTRYVFSEA